MRSINSEKKIVEQEFEKQDELNLIMKNTVHLNSNELPMGFRRRVIFRNDEMKECQKIVEELH